MSFKTKELAIIHILENGLLYKAGMIRQAGLWRVRA